MDNVDLIKKVSIREDKGKQIDTNVQILKFLIQVFTKCIDLFEKNIDRISNQVDNVLDNVLDNILDMF